MIRICKYCGNEFDAKGTQVYCKGPHVAKCVICGKEYTISTMNNFPKTCSKACKAALRKQSISNEIRTCLLCGKEFHPISNTTLYCNGPHYKPCPICGKPVLIKYPYQPTPGCSTECTNKLREQTCLDKYNVSVVSQSDIVKSKLHDSAVASESYKIQTIQEKYGTQYTNVAQIPEVRMKIQKRINSPECKQATAETNLQRYGVPFAMQSCELRSKQSRNSSNISSLEIRLINMLDQYNIEYQVHHVLKSNNIVHEFDIYLPKYKILIDCDGIYWHSYLEDPDGRKVRDDYDDTRLALIPDDHIFVAIIESDFERGLRNLQKLLLQMDNNIFSYDTDLFFWCRANGFPKFTYSTKRIHSDYAKLCKYDGEHYNPYCKLGISSIQQYHTSIYMCHIRNKVSPYDAWNDDTLLKQCIANRIIYQNDVDPSKVLQGFNVSKIAPKVSVFNPVLAKYLAVKYLSEFDSVFDPFSGFSGRLLGVCAAGKQYIGSDINSIVVTEANNIICELALQGEVSCRDVLSYDNVAFDCVLTCPPYADKEIYFDNMAIKSCDDWIQAVLDRITCKRYVFVVDGTQLYKDNVVEVLKNSSHLSSSNEYVVVIDT